MLLVSLNSSQNKIFYKELSYTLWFYYNILILILKVAIYFYLNVKY